MYERLVGTFSMTKARHRRSMSNFSMAILDVRLFLEKWEFPTGPNSGTLEPPGLTGPAPKSCVSGSELAARQPTLENCRAKGDWIWPWPGILPVIEIGVKLAAIGDSCTRLEELPGAKKGSEEGLNMVSRWIGITYHLRILVSLTANIVYETRHRSMGCRYWSRSDLLSAHLQEKTP